MEVRISFSFFEKAPFFMCLLLGHYFPRVKRLQKTIYLQGFLHIIHISEKGLQPHKCVFAENMKALQILSGRKNHLFGVFELFLGDLPARDEIGDLVDFLIKREFFDVGKGSVSFHFFGDKDVVVA